MSKSWQSERGDYGSRMVLRGPWTEKAGKAWASGKFQEIEANYAKGWPGGDLNFLRDLEHVLSLDVTDWSIDDVSPINHLSSLRALKVFTYCKTELQFDRMPELEQVSLEWRPMAGSLFDHTGISSLYVNHYSGKDLQRFCGMSGLRSLSLASPKIVSLSGIERMVALKVLAVEGARRLGGLSGIEGLTGLECLAINHCGKVSDITPVSPLSRLRELQLCDDGGIQSLCPIQDLMELEKVFFYGSTNILDGELSPLLRLPKLKEVAMMDRRHYSVKRDSLPGN